MDPAKHRDEPHAGHVETPSTVDAAVFNDFFRAQFLQVVRYLMLRGADYETAKDATQEAMIVLLRHWSLIKNPPGFVRRVAYRYCIDVQRRTRTELAAMVATYSSDGSAEGLDEPDEREQVYQLLGELPPKQQLTAALILSGLTLEEVAQVMGRPQSTVRSNARHAADRLKEMLLSTIRRGEGSSGRDRSFRESEGV